MIAHLLLLAAVGRPEIPMQLTLRQAIAAALSSSPALRQAAARVQQSEAQEGQSRAQTLPSLAIGVTDTGQTLNLRTLGINTPLLPPRAGPFQIIDARASAAHNLLDVPARDRIRASREQTKGARHLAEDARESLAFEIAIVFAETLRQQSRVGTLTKQVDLARRLDNITRDRFAQGVASKLDSKRSEIQVQNLMQNLLEAKNDLAAGKLSLARLMHAELSFGFELMETNYSDDPAAGSGRADYRAAESAVQAAELRLAAARHERLPSVTLRANYGQNGRGWNDNLNVFLAQGALNIPIYTGGRIEADIAEARARLAEAKAQLDEIRVQIDAEAMIARNALESATAELDVARKTVQLAREEVDLSLDRFTAGITDNSEVVDAQERLARTEDGILRAKFNFDLAQAKLRRATGASQ